jgi:hypothetical protein
MIMATNKAPWIAFQNCKRLRTDCTWRLPASVIADRAERLNGPEADGD